MILLESIPTPLHPKIWLVPWKSLVCVRIQIVVHAYRGLFAFCCPSLTLSMSSSLVRLLNTRQSAPNVVKVSFSWFWSLLLHVLSSSVIEFGILASW